MTPLAGAAVLVLGLGDSGLAIVRWCARCGAQVRVWDSREAPPQAGALAQQVPGAVLLTGDLMSDANGDRAAAALDGIQQVFKSPGLSPTDARIAGLLALAAERGIPVHGELDLFAAALQNLRAERGYAPQVVAITGTNGKTTTTAMTAMLIERTGKRVAVAGNIGPTMLQTLSDALDQEAPAPSPVVEHLPEVWVLELSSFQLHGVTGFEPSAAAVLNLTQDHLDWHGTMADYAEAKSRIFGQHAVMVINRDDAAVERMVPPTPYLSGLAKGRMATPPERHVMRFGLTAPRRSGDFGLITENGMAWLVRAMVSEETLKRARVIKGAAPAEEVALHIQRLMPADALRVRGRHNAANALAALALATAIGCPLAPMLHGLRDYTGEPHRVQFVATVDGVDAYDDSKGTNVGATVAALNGLGDDRSPAKLLPILGGDGKGQDFAPLREPVQRHARALATLGRDAAAIEAALAGCGVPMQRFETLEAATRWAFEQALSGDAVLLSPACASLDMFRNYAHRAEVFVTAVHARAAERGEVAV